MSPLQSLRQSSRLAWLALAWFGLTLAAAVAAPAIRPVQSMVICSAAGHYLQPLDADDAGVEHSRLHCPLCLTHVSAAPPPSPTHATVQPQAQALPRLDAGIRVAAGTVTPLPRAPPALSLTF